MEKLIPIRMAGVTYKEAVHGAIKLLTTPLKPERRCEALNDAIVLLEAAVARNDAIVAVRAKERKARR